MITEIQEKEEEKRELKEDTLWIQANPTTVGEAQRVYVLMRDEARDKWITTYIGKPSSQPWIDWRSTPEEVVHGLKYFEGEVTLSNEGD